MAPGESVRLTFQVERFRDIENELRPLFELNWHATALDKELIPLDVDYERYRSSDDNGLHITTARAGAELVGYFMNVVSFHPHYKTTLFAFMDIYFLAAEHRTAVNGMRLFDAAEHFLQALGVREMIANSKIINDVSGLFERLGWRKTAVVYTKILEAFNG